jgi:hypothetical protein
MDNGENHSTKASSLDDTDRRQEIVTWAVRWAIFGAAIGPILYLLIGVNFGMVTLDMIVIGGPILGGAVGGAVGIVGWLLTKICQRL